MGRIISGVPAPAAMSLGTNVMSSDRPAATATHAENAAPERAMGGGADNRAAPSSRVLFVSFIAVATGSGLTGGVSGPISASRDAEANCRRHITTTTAAVVDHQRQRPEKPAEIAEREEERALAAVEMAAGVGDQPGGAVREGFCLRRYPSRPPAAPRRP